MALLTLLSALVTGCAVVDLDDDDRAVEALDTVEGAIQGRVVSVEEGDRVVIFAGHMPLTIRLVGVDAPDKGQRYWKEAREFAERLALGMDVQVRGYERDSQGTVRAHLFLPDGRCLNEELLQAGWAWWVNTEITDGTFFLEREATQRARLVGRA
jgi:micrococcal nuclease